jgi:hypothetical protein
MVTTILALSHHRIVVSFWGLTVGLRQAITPSSILNPPRRTMRWTSRPLVIATALLAAAAISPGVSLGQGASPSPAPDTLVDPSAAPSPGEPSPGPASSLPGVLLQEDFSRPGDWWVGSDRFSTNAYRDGGYGVQMNRGGRSQWDWRKLPDARDRLKVEALVLVEQGQGAGGPICGAAGGNDSWFWAGTNGAEWLVGRIADTRLQVAERGPLPMVRDPDAPVGGALPSRVTLECAVDPDGAGDRVVVWVDGVQVADIVDSAIGPFDKGGLVYSSDRKGARLLFDDLVVSDPAVAEAAAARPVASPEPPPAGSASPAPDA